jgi:hypothetical protein
VLSNLAQGQGNLPAWLQWAVDRVVDGWGYIDGFMDLLLGSPVVSGICTGVGAVALICGGIGLAMQNYEQDKPKVLIIITLSGAGLLLLLWISGNLSDVPFRGFLNGGQ